MRRLISFLEETSTRFRRFVLRFINEDKYKINDLEVIADKISKQRKEYRQTIDDSNKLEEHLSKIVYDHQMEDTELKDLFHKLNYQRVVDDMTTKITIWKWVLLFFAFGTIFGLYFWATSYDTFVPQNTSDGILSDYERMMSAIDLEVNWQKGGHPTYPKKYHEGHQFSGQVDSTFVELAVTKIEPRKEQNVQALATATSTFWNIYFIRYLLIRVFITLVLIMLLNAGVKVYMRLRRDRMSLIYREEATTSIIYFIEKYIATKKDGNKSFTDIDKAKISQILPLIVKELYHNPDSNNSVKDHQSIIEGLMQMTQNMFSSAVATKSSQGGKR